MKKFLLFLVVLTQHTFAATFQNDATPVTMSGKNPAHDYAFAIIRASDGTRYASATYTPNGGTGLDPITKTVNSAQLTFDFYIVCYSAPSGLWTQVSSGKKYRWISAYEVGGTEPQFSTSGAFSPTGDPTDDAGNPANPAAGAPPTAYEKELTLTNSNAYTIGKQIQMVSNIGQVIRVVNAQLPPQSAKTWLFKHSAPFNLLVYDMKPDTQFDGNGNPIGDVWTKSSATPEQTVSATGTTNPTPASPTATEKSRTNTASPTQAAAQKNTMSTATTGATSKDVNDSANNIGNEIARGTEQTRASGDQVAGAINEMGDKLSKKLDSTSDTGGGVLDSGPSVATPEASAMTFATNRGDKAYTLTSAVTNFATAAGLGGNAGSAALSWNIPFPYFGVQTVSLEEYSEYFTMSRTFILWILGIGFIYQMFFAVRGAFAGK